FPADHLERVRLDRRAKRGERLIELPGGEMIVPGQRLAERIGFVAERAAAARERVGASLRWAAGRGQLEVHQRALDRAGRDRTWPVAVQVGEQGGARVDARARCFG